MSLVPVDTTSALAVTDYLTKARDWLSTAVETSTTHGIADAKAELSVAAEATKQLGLSQEIRDDATEMVRRAEYALGKSIRKGQSEGTIRRQGQRNADGDKYRDLPSPYEFATQDDLTANGAGIYHLAQAEPVEFDEAIAEAKAEGNLSRANVARIAREKSGKPSVQADRRDDHEADLINAVASVLRPLTTKNAATLTPKTKTRLIRVLEIAIRNLKGEDQ